MNQQIVADMFADLTDETLAILTKPKDELSSAISAISGVPNIAPQYCDIFRAFVLCPIERAKICIIGNEPYSSVGIDGKPIANGLAFSTSSKMLPTTKAMFASLIHAKLIAEMPKNGDLTNWARQGVLLLNSSLTAVIGETAAHASIWAKYIAQLIADLKKRPIIFICFGTHARNLIGEHPHLYWAYPTSNLQTFINNDTFMKANLMLHERCEKEINWDTRAVIEKTIITLGEDITPKQLYVFTDGAATKNGRENCRASYAYYICEYSANTVDNSKTIINKADLVPPSTIPGEKYSSSNNRGELMAIMMALKYIADEKFRTDSIIVVSDSEYSINCITKWAPNWYKDPIKHSLSEKKNLDLIKPALDYLREVRQHNSVSFRHIKSHTKAPADKVSFEWFLWNGNDTADKLCANLLKS
jgi:uracil-DNA glycosylase